MWLVQNSRSLSCCGYLCRLWRNRRDYHLWRGKWFVSAHIGCTPLWDLERGITNKSQFRINVLPLKDLLLLLTLNPTPLKLKEDSNSMLALTRSKHASAYAKVTPRASSVTKLMQLILVLSSVLNSSKKLVMLKTDSACVCVWSNWSSTSPTLPLAIKTKP